MSALLESALRVKAAREAERLALDVMMGLDKLPPADITTERVDRAMRAANVAIDARFQAEAEFHALIGAGPRPFSVVEAEK